MHNILQCSSNYSDTTCRLWFYSKDEATIFTVKDTKLYVPALTLENPDNAIVANKSMYVLVILEKIK